MTTLLRRALPFVIALTLGAAAPAFAQAPGSTSDTGTAAPAGAMSSSTMASGSASTKSRMGKRKAKTSMRASAGMGGKSAGNMPEPTPQNAGDSTMGSNGPVTDTATPAMSTPRPKR